MNPVAQLPSKSAWAKGPPAPSTGHRSPPSAIQFECKEDSKLVELGPHQNRNTSTALALPNFQFVAKSSAAVPVISLKSPKEQDIKSLPRIEPSSDANGVSNNVSDGKIRSGVQVNSKPAFDVKSLFRGAHMTTPSTLSPTSSLVISRNNSSGSQVHSQHASQPQSSAHVNESIGPSVVGLPRQTVPGHSPNSPRTMNVTRNMHNAQASGRIVVNSGPATYSPHSVSNQLSSGPQHHVSPGSPSNVHSPMWQTYYYPTYVPPTAAAEHFVATSYTTPPPWHSVHQSSGQSVGQLVNALPVPQHNSGVPPPTVSPYNYSRLNTNASAFVPTMPLRSSKVTIKNIDGQELNLHDIRKSAVDLKLADRRRSSAGNSSLSFPSAPGTNTPPISTAPDTMDVVNSDSGVPISDDLQGPGSTKFTCDDAIKTATDCSSQESMSSGAPITTNLDSVIFNAPLLESEGNSLILSQNSIMLRNIDEALILVEASELPLRDSLLTALQEKRIRDPLPKNNASDGALTSDRKDFVRKRPVPGPLNLSSTRSEITMSLPSALATARVIQDITQIPYPEGIRSPSVDLNLDAKEGRFRYDREFLMQFMSVCREKPDNLPSLDAIGLEPADQVHALGRTGSGRRSGSMNLNPASAKSSSLGLGLIGGALGARSATSAFSMGQFGMNAKSLSNEERARLSEERFLRSSSSASLSNASALSRHPPMIRTASQSGNSGAVGNKRTRSKRGEQRSDLNRLTVVNQIGSNLSSGHLGNLGFESIRGLEVSSNRWEPHSVAKKRPDSEGSHSNNVDKKVRLLLNKLTLEKFESISNQVITWANTSENEKDGHTLIQVIKLVFEKATDEAAWSEMYAKLCRKMMEQISDKVQDDGIRGADGYPIRGGLLFRKYLLNRCQEDFERGWKHKEATAAAAVGKAGEDQASIDRNDGANESILYSDEYYAAQKAKRQGLGLVRFIGELFKLQMLTERIMHECVKKLISNVDNPEEEEIESLCKLLTTVGKALDTPKARGHMDVYFSRMKDLATGGRVSHRIQFMLLDIIELRDRKWIPRSQSSVPSTIAEIHEAAAKEKAQVEKEFSIRSIPVSRVGSRRGVDRADTSLGADGWAIAGNSAPIRPAPKAGDLSQFGKINKASSGAMTFGPSSIFSTKKDVKTRENAALSRSSSSANMFSMLSQVADPVERSNKTKQSMRLSHPDQQYVEPATSESITGEGQVRPKLNLLPRSGAASHNPEQTSGVDTLKNEEDSEVQMSKPTDQQIDQDVLEFFAIRNLEDGESYFTNLCVESKRLLLEKLVKTAVESGGNDASLVCALFTRLNEKRVCSTEDFSKGFMRVTESLDDLSIDVPRAVEWMATMLKGVPFTLAQLKNLVQYSTSQTRLLELVLA